MKMAVEIRNLHQTYKNSALFSLQDINLSISRNKIFGLLGPNGAGKSTLIKCINNIIKPDRGSIKIAGLPLENAVNFIGYMPEEAALPEFLTGRDFLVFIAHLRNISRVQMNASINELHDVFELPDLDKLTGHYSKGNKEKLLFVAAVMHKPVVLILDEPFTGLDPVVIHKAKLYLKNYVKADNCIIFSTHILEWPNSYVMRLPFCTMAK